MKSNVYVLVFLSLLRLSCVHASVPLPVNRQTTPFPPLDQPPVPQPLQASFDLPLLLESPLFGLTAVLISGIKLFLSQHLSLPSSSLFYIEGRAVPPDDAMFHLNFRILASKSDLASLEESAISFVSDGDLDDSFAQGGIPAVTFSVIQSSMDAIANPSNNSTVLPTNSTATIANIASTVTATTIPASNTSSPFNASITESPSPQPSPTTPPPLVDILPDIFPPLQLSDPLVLCVHSPIIGFPYDLKEGIIWFLANHTGTRSKQPSWFMTSISIVDPPPAPSRYRYLSQLVHVTNNSTPSSSQTTVINEATSYVADGQLTSDLHMQSKAISVNVTLLPPVTLSSPDPTPLASPPTVSVPIFLNVTAPITGLPGAVVDAILSSSARATNTERSIWHYTHVELTPDSVNNGPIVMDLVVTINNTHTVKVVNSMASFVRNRQLDDELIQAGWTDVRIHLRPRLTRFGADGRGGLSPGSPSAATVVASVVGFVVVLVVAGMILTLVPRSPLSGQARSIASNAR